MQAGTNPFVSIEDVAKHFAVSVSTVRNWVRQGEIPKDTYLKVGHVYRFDLLKVVEALTNAPKQMELDFNDDDN
jgi:excisionase family DNA binding protein